MKQNICLEIPNHRIRKKELKTMKAEKEYSWSSFLNLGALFILFAGAIVFGGCASTGGGPIAAAHRIHSMTPCGIVMDAMMGNGHSGHGEHTSRHEIPSDSEVQQQAVLSEERAP